MSNPRGRLAGALFFLSGAVALVLEVVWLRGFALILGSTLRAMACVLTAFMLGLAVGSALAAWRLRRGDLSRAQALRTYGWLELGIGAYGVALTSALFVAPEPFLALVGSLHRDSALVALLGDFSLSFLLMAAPTTAMGATLPLLVVTLRSPACAPTLYALNLLGAAAGSLLASFVLIYFFGTIGAVVVAAAGGAVIFAGARRLARSDEPISLASGAAGEPDAAAVQPPWSPRVALALAFFSGFVFFSAELVWNRVLSLVLGNRVYVTSFTLAIVLLALALGASLARRALRRGDARGAVMLGLSVAAASLAVALLMSPVLAGGSGLAQLVFLVWLVPVPAAALGMVFPVLIALPVAGRPHAAAVGRIAAANTLGSMLGALAAGYGLVPLVGSQGVLLIDLALVLACVAFMGSRARSDRLVRAGLAVLVTATVALRWDRPISDVDPREAVVQDEDEHCIFSVTRVGDGELDVRCTGTSLVYHFGAARTMFVQATQAHFPMAFTRDAERVLVIGSGYGITAGAFGIYPDDMVVDAVEILPLMVQYAGLFASGNEGYLRNPKVAVHVADGRHFLALADGLYDVISVNITDPYTAGSGSLCNREFLALAKRKLAPGGVACWHAFGPDRASLYRSFRAHYRYVRAVPSYGTGLSLLGSDRPLDGFRRDPHADARVRRALGAIGIPTAAAMERLLAEGDAQLRELEQEPDTFISSDIFPRLEFRRSDAVDTFRSNH